MWIFSYLKQGRSYKLRLHEWFSFLKWGSTASWSFLKHAFGLFCLKDMLSMKAFEHDLAVLYNCCNIQCTWLVILPHILYLCFVITVWLWYFFIHRSQSFCCEVRRNGMLVSHMEVKWCCFNLSLVLWIVFMALCNTCSLW